MSIKCTNSVCLGALRYYDTKQRKWFFYSKDDCLRLGIEPTFFVPCGKCKSCERRKKGDMTTRIMHEMQMHNASCFITLTYNDKYLPKDEKTKKPILVKRDVQLFIKRLRFSLGNLRIRYFIVGEYGCKGQRPHYHILLFGYMPVDVYPFFNAGKYFVFRSPSIEKLWDKGFVTIGSCNLGCARYCAQYVQKKMNKNSDFIVDEFFLQSKGHGEGAIGSFYFDKYYKDIVNLNHCLLKNSNGEVYSVRIPDYYLMRLRNKHYEEWFDLFCRRMDFVLQNQMSIVDDETIEKKFKDDLASLEKYVIETQEKIKRRTLNEKVNIYDLRF